MNAIDKLGGLTADAISPTIRSGQVCSRACEPMGTRSGIDRPFVFQVGRAGCLLDVSTAARTGINQLPRPKRLECGFVMGKPRALYDRTDIPIETKPVQVFTGLR